MSPPDAILIPASATIEQAFRQFNAARRGILFTVAEDGRVVGCVTDGDIRRQLLIKDDLKTPLAGFMIREFVRAAIGTPREQILKLLDGRVQAVPVLDDAGKLVGICTREEFLLLVVSETIARARAPARISFGGGGTDITLFFSSLVGVFINSTIAKSAHATPRARLHGRI